MIRLLKKNGKIFILEVALTGPRDKNSFSDSIVHPGVKMEYLIRHLKSRSDY